jgi:hypothetical protein
MNSEHTGHTPEPVSAESTPDTSAEAHSTWDLEHVQKRPAATGFHYEVYKVSPHERTSDPHADTVEIPVVGASHDSDLEVDDYSHTTIPTGKPGGRHRADIGRHVTRGERKSRLESRMPVALGRLAYRVASGLDTFINNRRDRKFNDGQYDDTETFEDDTQTDIEEAPSEEPAPRTYEQQVREAETERAQSDLETTERRQNRIQRIRSALFATAAAASLAAVLTSSNMRSSGPADATQELSAKGTDKTLVIGDSESSRNEGISRKYRELDEAAANKAQPVEQLPDGEASLWSEAMKIDQGEGLFDTFKQMEIQEEKWDLLMQKVGPKLEDSGEAYYDAANHEYRLKGDGKLKREAVKLIAETARKIEV